MTNVKDLDKELSQEQNLDPVIWGLKEHPDEGPLYFTPRYARLVDSSIDSKARYSVLVIGELLVDTPLYKNENDEDMTPIPAGHPVGVWISGHGKKLINLCGTMVKLEATGETKDVGKPSPMRLFSIKTKKDIVRKLVPLEADFRDDSRSLPSPWDAQILRGRQLAEATAARNGAIDPSEDIPF